MKVTATVFVVVQVPASSFTANGSNFFFRRLTSIAQPTVKATSGEYFGYPNLGKSPNLPNTANNTLEYVSWIVLGGSSGGSIDSTIGNAGSDPNDATKIVVKSGRAHTGTDFNDCESINLHS